MVKTWSRGHFDQRRDIQPIDKRAQGARAGSNATDPRQALVARVENDCSAIAQILVHAHACIIRQSILTVGHRPIDQGEKGQLVPFHVQPNGRTWLDRGSAREDLAQSEQARTAGFVNLVVAGQNIGEMGSLGRLQRETITGLGLD